MFGERPNPEATQLADAAIAEEDRLVSKLEALVAVPAGWRNRGDVRRIHMAMGRVKDMLKFSPIVFKRHTGGQADRWTEGRTGKRTDERTDRLAHRQAHGNTFASCL